MIWGIFLEHVCQAVGCPGRHSRRPGPGWCRRSIDKKRKGLLPLRLAVAARLLAVAQKAGFSPSGDVVL